MSLKPPGVPTALSSLSDLREELDDLELTELADVSGTAPADGQVPAFDNSTGLFVFSDVTSTAAIDSPDDIASMWSYYDSRYITPVTDGTAVSQWNDLISSRHVVQATGANQPLYKTAIQNGQPVVRFDGTNDFMLCQVATGNVTTTNGSPNLTGITTTGGAWQAGLEITATGISASTTLLSVDGAGNAVMSANATASGTVAAVGAIPQPFTVFAVVRASLGAVSNECVWDGGAGVQISAQAASGGRYSIFTGANQIVQSPKDNAFKIISAVVNGGTSKIRNNGVTNTGTLLTGSPIRIRFGLLNAGTEPLNGDIAAFGIFKSALTVSQLDALDTLLGAV